MLANIVNFNDISEERGERNLNLGCGLMVVT